MKLEKGNTDPDLLLGHKSFVLRNKCTCGVFFCPSVHKGDQNHSLSIMQIPAYFSSLSPCYSSTKIMIVARMFSTISPEHIRHLFLQLFTHFVPSSYTLYCFLHYVLPTLEGFLQIPHFIIIQLSNIIFILNISFLSYKSYRTYFYTSFMVLTIYSLAY